MNKHFGRVKWFGGLNRKTNKENEFGFLESMGGEDVFLHKRAFYGDSAPAENEVLVYAREERDGKASAQNAYRLTESSASVVDVFTALQELSLEKTEPQLQPFLKPLLADFSRRLVSASSAELEQLRGHGVRNSAYELLRALNDLPAGIGRSTGEGDWAVSFERLVEPYGVNVWSHVPWKAVPPHLLASNEEAIATFLSGMSIESAKALVLQNIGSLSGTLLFFLCAKGVLTTREELGSQHRRLDMLLKGMFGPRPTTLPEYAKAVYEQELKPKGGYRSCPVLWGIIEPLLFKQYLFEKNERFFPVYRASTALSADLETFVLFNLLSLSHAGNTPAELITIFQQRLWEALIEGKIDLGAQVEQVHKLFPPHRYGGKTELSCEAVYWEKEDMYLCRGKECANPQVIPNLKKHYLDFNVYDWLAHYGINFALEKKPSSKDFAIKLAGYFNRLREIWPALHCRSCAKVLVPDFRFSRTEYKDYENGEYVVKAMAAAYRLTVFHCNNESCVEHKVGYYISHCMGQGCKHIIDARDLKVRCDEGRYVCRGCGSCCDTHSTQRPIGICGGCGKGLKLFEGLPEKYPDGKRYGRGVRFARCEESCGFEIPAPLPQKFYSPACQPVYPEAEAVR